MIWKAPYMMLCLTGLERTCIATGVFEDMFHLEQVIRG